MAVIKLLATRRAAIVFFLIFLALSLLAAAGFSWNPLWLLSGALLGAGLLAYWHRVRTKMSGSSLFHIGLVVIILGGVVTMFTRTTGYLEIATGDRVPVSMNGFSRFEITLDQLRTSFWDNGEIRAVDSTIKLYPPQKPPVTGGVAPNRPMAFDWSRVFLTRYGTTASFTLFDHAGTSLGRLKIFFDDAMEGGLKKVTTFPGTILEIGAALPPRGSSAPVRVALATDDRPFAMANLLPGEQLTFDGGRLSYDGLSPWAGFLFVRDYGRPIVWIGFLLAGIGLAMRSLRERFPLAYN